MLAVVACTRGAQTTPTPGTDGPSTLEAPYIVRAAGAVKPLRGPTDDAAAVLGLPLIGAAALPDGVRELRVGDDYSMFVGSPAPVLRLLQRTGRSDGQLVFVWHEHVAWPKRHRATTCTPWTDSARTCAFISPVALDWTSVIARFDALGAWTITADCASESRTMPNGSVEIGMRHITDVGELHLGRIVGSAGSIYRCNAPRARTRTSDGRAAIAIYDYFLDVIKQSGGPPAA